MIRFINREAEMALIDDAFKALGNYEEELLRTPIINFYGVEGIGKTAILSEVERKCRDQNLRYILIETVRNSQDISHLLTALVVLILSRSYVLMKTSYFRLKDTKITTMFSLNLPDRVLIFL